MTRPRGPPRRAPGDPASRNAPLGLSGPFGRRSVCSPGTARPQVCKNCATTGAALRPSFADRLGRSPRRPTTVPRKPGEGERLRDRSSSPQNARHPDDEPRAAIGPDSTSIRPPCAWAILLAMNRPRPVPRPLGGEETEDLLARLAVHADPVVLHLNSTAFSSPRTRTMTACEGFRVTRQASIVLRRLTSKARRARGSTSRTPVLRRLAAQLGRLSRSASTPQTSRPAPAPTSARPPVPAPWRSRGCSSPCRGCARCSAGPSPNPASRAGIVLLQPGVDQVRAAVQAGEQALDAVGDRAINMPIDSSCDCRRRIGVMSALISMTWRIAPSASRIGAV